MSKIESSNIIRGSTIGLTSGDSGSSRITRVLLEWGDMTYLRWGNETFLRHKLRD